MNPSAFNMYRGTRQFFGVEGDGTDSAAPVAASDAAVTATDTTVGKKLDDVIEQMYNGWVGTGELIIYVIFLSLFITLILNSKAIYEDLSGSTIYQDLSGSKIPSTISITNKNYLAMMGVCGVGILLCLIRIAWSHVFFVRASKLESGRVVELIFSSIITALFGAAMGLAADTRLNTINKIASTADSNTLTATKTESTSELIVAGVGIGLSGLYLGFNIYFVSKNKNVIV